MQNAVWIDQQSTKKMSHLAGDSIVILLLLASFVVQRGVSGTCRGCVELDELTFDRTLRRYPDGALVKFDVAYPYGEKHEAYAQFAADVANVTRAYGTNPAPNEDLLVAVVGVKVS